VAAQTYDMGCGASTPVKDGANATTTAASHRDMRSKDSSQRGPDLFVAPEYKRVKHLGESHLHDISLNRPQPLTLPRAPRPPGRGGTGDTWAFIDTRTGKEVAIKFIKRPLPKVLLQNIQREFTVSFSFYHDVSCCCLYSSFIAALAIHTHRLDLFLSFNTLLIPK
jgi:hypothetical protein